MIYKLYVRHPLSGVRVYFLRGCKSKYDLYAVVGAYFMRSVEHIDYLSYEEVLPSDVPSDSDFLNLSEDGKYLISRSSKHTINIKG